MNESIEPEEKLDGKSNYLEFASNLAKAAGKIMIDNFQSGMDKEWKSDNSPITIADKKISELVINEIGKSFPDHNVRTEEGNGAEKDSEYLWVCDPIDGTIPFSHSIPIFTFSLALIKNGDSIMGVVYDPIMDRLFAAEKGKGAFLNSRPINVSNHSSILQSVIALENFESAKYPLWRIEENLAKQGCKVMKLCSFVYPSCLVANGEILGTIFPNDTAHDVAATKIIIEEAGGKVTDLYGNEQRYDQPIRGAILSNGIIHRQLVDEVSKVIDK